MLRLLAAAVLALALLPDAARAELKVCNKSNSPVTQVAIGYEDEKDGWTSKGWTEIKKEQCATLIPGELQQRYFYVYATGDNIVWEADDDQEGAYFCIAETGPFALHDKDFESKDNVPDCEAKSNATKKFDEIDTENEADYTWNLED